MSAPYSLLLTDPDAHQSAIPRQARVLRNVFMLAGWGIAIGSLDGQALDDVNPAFATMHGYTPDELRGRPSAIVFAPRVWDEARAQIARVRELGRHVFESVHVRRDGSEFPVLIDASLVHDEHDGLDYRVVSVQDISAQKQVEQALREAHDQLRQWSAHQNEVLEAERHRIAREVHDELGQLLTALKMDVSTLGLKFAHVDSMSPAVDDMQLLLGRIMTVVRQVAGDLRPPVLDLGLFAAVEWLASENRRRHGLDCVIACPQGDTVSEGLSASVLTVAFRCVQESLTNVVRHARASQVVIHLTRQAGVLLVRIADNGDGLDPQAVFSGPAFGLKGMRERVQALGGRFSVLSKAGNGAIIEIDLPLHKE